jgi:hypothetical protein
MWNVPGAVPEAMRFQKPGFSEKAGLLLAGKLPTSHFAFTLPSLATSFNLP